MMQKLKSKLSKLGIDLTDHQLDQFERYYELLIEWNQKINLTAITEKNEVIDKHFVDSLSIVKGMDMNSVNSLIDIGTGAGFPGIPLKIVFPHLEVTLLDSLNKRINFLKLVSEELKLEKVTCLHGRAEDFAKESAYREQYDLCVSRAVANLSTLSEYCIPYIRVGGIFASYKSGEIADELSASKLALSILKAKLEKVEEFILPETEIKRSLVIIKKVEKLPGKYPRKAPLPSKKPL